MQSSRTCSRRDFLKRSIALGLVGLTDEKAWSVSGKSAREAAFVPVMLTPFQADLSLDTEGLKRLIEFYQKSGAGGLFANCLSSEMYHLSDAERQEITAISVKYADRGIPVVATGSFGETLEEKIACTKRMGDLGVDAVVLITSHFAEKGQESQVLLDNMLALAEQTRGISLGTYECPTPYKRLLSDEEFQVLTATERFTYHKDTSESIERLIRKIEIGRRGAYRVYNAHSGTAVPFISAGGSGLSPIAGNFFPEIFAWIAKHARRTDVSDQLAYIQQELIVAEETVSLKYPLGAKYFLQKRGVPIQITSRVQNKQLTNDDIVALDGLYKKFETWCETLAI